MEGKRKRPRSPGSARESRGSRHDKREDRGRKYTAGNRGDRYSAKETKPRERIREFKEETKRDRASDRRESRDRSQGDSREYYRRKSGSMRSEREIGGANSLRNGADNSKKHFKGSRSADLSPRRLYGRRRSSEKLHPSERRSRVIVPNRSAFASIIKSTAESRDKEDEREWERSQRKLRELEERQAKGASKSFFSSIPM